MMTGIAKTSEVNKVETPKIQSATFPPPTGIANFEWQGIPIDCLRHFNIELGTIPQKDLDQVKEIVSWAKSKCDEPTIGNILQQISKIQNTLGVPALNEKSYSKVWRFCTLQKHIDEMRKRQESLYRPRLV
jgi:hypothetical protein